MKGENTVFKKLIFAGQIFFHHFLMKNKNFHPNVRLLRVVIYGISFTFFNNSTERYYKLRIKYLLDFSSAEISQNIFYRLRFLGIKCKQSNSNLLPIIKMLTINRFLLYFFFGIILELYIENQYNN